MSHRKRLPHSARQNSASFPGTTVPKIFLTGSGVIVYRFAKEQKIMPCSPVFHGIVVATETESKIASTATSFLREPERQKLLEGVFNLFTQKVFAPVCCTAPRRWETQLSSRFRMMAQVIAVVLIVQFIVVRLQPVRFIHVQPGSIGIETKFSIHSGVRYALRNQRAPPLR